MDFRELVKHLKSGIVCLLNADDDILLLIIKGQNIATLYIANTFGVFYLKDMVICQRVFCHFGHF